MPDFNVPPWSDWLPLIRDPIGPTLLIVVLGLIALRGARLFVHGVVKTVFDRNAAHSGGKEQSTIEVAKRRDTIETLGSRVIQGFILVVAILMIIDKLGYAIGPAVAGFGVVGIAVGFGA